jgi:cytochrome b involved in lipid metabolism
MSAQESQELPVVIRAEVAKHSSETDAWVIINKVVYDVTSYSKVHPGKAGPLLKWAGKDASEAFGKVVPHQEKQLADKIPTYVFEGKRLAVAQVQD